MKDDEENKDSSPPPSSFPVSSPTFWTEAVDTIDATITDGKRRPLDHDEPTALDPVDNGEADPYRKAGKRARFVSPNPSDAGPPSSPLLQLAKTEDGDTTTEGTGSRTSLAYLPNRLDPSLFDASNAYLAAPEYAPNKFGDIGDYMRKKEVKVQTQNRDIALSTADPNLPQIFAGQSFWINGNTHPPMEELRKMILQRGGEVRPKLWNKGYVNYIIAPILTQMKFKEFKNYKVVKEGWIVESCKEGKMLDWTRWKLQVEGGWEETGRKGLEGFLRGAPSQRPAKVEEQDEESLPADFGVAAEAVVGNRELAKEPHEGSILNASSNTAATQSLINPSRTTQIPISPGYRRAVAALEMLPGKVQKPEGAWENYYTKDSNEHAAEALRNSDWRVRNTAERGNEGGFIDGYYQNSRLHHLSTWKAELKVLVAAAQKQSEENSLSRPSHSNVDPYSLSTAQLPKTAALVPSFGNKVIFHVDFDCFFVSCGLATRPHLKGKPSVVCHSQTGKNASTSEIASASYEARAKGVKNGMSLGRARQLVGDDLQTIPYEFDTYKKYSLSFYTVLMGYADELQAVSVDEALIDVTSAVRAREIGPEEAESEFTDGEPRLRKPRNAAAEIAQKIRDDVRKLTDGCEVSIGIAHNILLAKLATRAAKPAGVYHLTNPLVPDFLIDLDVKDLPSIGYSTASKIEEKFGTTKCGALLEITKSALQKTLGPKTGEMVFGYLRGQDDRKIEPHKERKSISAEMNYGIRFRNQEQAEICITDLAAEVAKRLKQINVRGRLLTLKLMSRHPDAPIEPPKFLGHGWCETFNKSVSISNKGGSATDDPAILGVESVKLLRAMSLDPIELRGIGIQITKLDGETGKTTERETGQGLLSFGRNQKSKTEKVDTKPSSVAVASGAPSDLQVPVPVAVPRLNARSRSQSKSRSRSLTPPEIVSPPRQALVIASPPPVSASPPPIESDWSRRMGIEAGPSRIPTSSDGIDPDFLAALPPELRQEVKRDHAITRAKARERAESERPKADSPLIDDVDERTRAATISPLRQKGMHKTAHITKQLRPKNKTQMKASAISNLPLYGAWNKAQQRDSDDDESYEVDDRPKFVSEDEGGKIGIYFIRDLRELGIDPSFLKDLPEDMQKEVVDAEMARKKQRQLLHRPADTSRVRQQAQARLRGRGRGGLTRASISPTRSSRAGSAQPITAPRIANITITRPSKPKLYNATTLPEVCEIMTKWIESRKGSGPATKDSNKVKGYLVRLMAPESGLGGVEMAIEVLKFMWVAIDSKWEEGACEDDIAGGEWWGTWNSFRSEVDQLHRQRFGAGIRM